MNCYDFDEDEIYLTENRREHTILKLNAVFKMGYIPSRGLQDYTSKVRNRPTRNLANCFEHACFNLTDDLFEKYCFNFADTESFREFYELCKPNTEPENLASCLTNFILETGLEVESCNVNYVVDQRCEWKVAIYFSEILTDFHFMIQEKSGVWSSKIGFQERVEVCQSLPNVFDQYYKLYDVKKITNPYIKELEK